MRVLEEAEKEFDAIRALQEPGSGARASVVGEKKCPLCLKVISTKASLD